MIGELMPIVRMDGKGRIQLPSELRAEWRLKPKQPLILKVEPDKVEISKFGQLDPTRDPLLRDILVNPGHSKVKVTRRLLRQLERDQLG